jgi:hypothetical protein
MFRLRGEVRAEVHSAEQTQGQARGEGETGARETDPLRQQEVQTSLRVRLRLGL